MSIYDAAPIDPPNEKQKTRPDSYGVASRGQGKAPQIRNNDRVNEHIAALLVKYGMDYDAVVEKMLPEGTPEGHIHALARTLEQRPGVQRFLQERLGAVGLTVDAEKIYIAKLAEVALDKKNKNWAPAMKMISEYYGWSKKSEDGDKPVTLVFKGFEKELTAMFDGNLPSANAPARRPIIEKEVVEDEEPDSVQ